MNTANFCVAQVSQNVRALGEFRNGAAASHASKKNYCCPYSDDATLESVGADSEEAARAALLILGRLQKIKKGSWARNTNDNMQSYKISLTGATAECRWLRGAGRVLRRSAFPISLSPPESSAKRDTARDKRTGAHRTVALPLSTINGADPAEAGTYTRRSLGQWEGLLMSRRLGTCNKPQDANGGLSTAAATGKETICLTWTNHKFDWSKKAKNHQTRDDIAQ